LVPSPLWGEGDLAKPSRVRGQKLTPDGVAKARLLRRKETEAERRLWNYVRNRSVRGLKVVRQHAIGPFVADFVCRDLMLVIEVDGSQHADAAADAARTAFLNARGYSVLRFWNNEVLSELDAVGAMLLAIADGIATDPSPGWRYSPATLSPEGRGDDDRMTRR
jgi:very-short-patch-repair endonuclease